MNAEFSDIPLHSSIRWLSAGKMLQHFFCSSERYPFISSKWAAE